MSERDGAPRALTSCTYTFLDLYDYTNRCGCLYCLLPSRSRFHLFSLCRSSPCFVLNRLSLVYTRTGNPLCYPALTSENDVAIVSSKTSNIQTHDSWSKKVKGSRRNKARTMPYECTYPSTSTSTPKRLSHPQRRRYSTLAKGRG